MRKEHCYKNSRLQELRFIVTQECTHDCIFCHGEGLGLHLKKKEFLVADDIDFIFNVGRLYFGFEHTTLTGGELLMRRDIINIAEKIKRNFGKVTLTTNGLLLLEKVYIGNYLDRLNISIHSLNEREYEKISRRKNVFHKIIYGLEQFRSKFANIKIRLNVTLVRGINDNEKNINELINFASRLNASIKFIEFYPMESRFFVPLDEIEKVILCKGFKPIVSMTRKKNYHNGIIEIGLTKIFCALIVQSNDPSFCSDNNDLFISPYGTIKPCRHNQLEIDIIPEIKRHDYSGLHKKLLLAFSALREDCILLKNKLTKGEKQ